MVVCCLCIDFRLADKLANGKEPKEARQGCVIAIAIMVQERHSAVKQKPVDSRKNTHFSLAWRPAWKFCRLTGMDDGVGNLCSGVRPS